MASYCIQSPFCDEDSCGCDKWEEFEKTLLD